MTGLYPWLVLSGVVATIAGLILSCWRARRARRAYEQARRERDQEFAQLERNLTLLLTHMLPPRDPHV